MNTLVDTSVWISHFHKTNTPLLELLESKSILIHPFIFGELASGSLPSRDRLLFDLKMIPQIQEMPHEEVLHFIEKSKLYGKGLGFVDFHLLASCLKYDCTLYTHDQKLKKIYDTLSS